MSKNRIAIPSENPGGLKAQRSGHFGRCDVFTIIDIEQGVIKDVHAISNVDHTEGGCLVPVNLLAEQGVNGIIVSGMGLRPLMGFKNAGIKVYLGEGVTVEDSINGLLQDKLSMMTEEYVCGGH
ncbi:MAG: dinitrogenase iron-molybdenum cofactor biosynthesis protein [Desulfitibacter sp. BRH_c19]|nr:MAG: dinitrogenase iron-molybdenum cofactor biosynthesis protein [Desulfitibacter sp. BRH_c19]